MTDPMQRSLSGHLSRSRLARRLGPMAVVSLAAVVSLWLVGLASAQPTADTPAPATKLPLDFVVIVNSKNPAKTVDKDRLSKMFLKKIKRWEDSELDVKTFDLLEDSDVRDKFTRAVHNKNISAIKSFWQRMIFSGRDVPPDEMEDDEKMMAAIAAEQGAVGYVAGTTQLIDGVRPIEVTDD